MIKNIKIYNYKITLLEENFERVNIIHSTNQNIDENELGSNIENKGDENECGKSLIFHAFGLIFTGSSSVNRTDLIEITNSNKERGLPFIDDGYTIEIKSDKGVILKRQLKFNDETKKYEADDLQIKESDVSKFKPVDKSNAFDEVIIHFFDNWPKFIGMQKFSVTNKTFALNKKKFVPYIHYSNFWIWNQYGDESTEFKTNPFSLETPHYKNTVLNSSILNSLFNFEVELPSNDDFVELRNRTKSTKEDSAFTKQLKMLKKNLNKSEDILDDSEFEEIENLKNEIDFISYDLKNAILKNPKSFINLKQNKNNESDYDKLNEITISEKINELSEKINIFNKKIKEISVKNGNEVVLGLLAEYQIENEEEIKKEEIEKVNNLWLEYDEKIKILEQNSKVFMGKIELLKGKGSSYRKSCFELLGELPKLIKKDKINVPLMIFDDLICMISGDNISKVTEEVFKTLEKYQYQQLFITTSDSNEFIELKKTFEILEPKIIKMNLLNFETGKN